MSYSFRNRPKLSDRYRGKSGDEILNELKSKLDEDRKMFFEASPGWNNAQSPGSFGRASPLDDMMSRGRQDIRSHLDDLAQRHPEFADHLRCPPWGGEVGTSSQTSWGKKRRGSGSSGDDGSSVDPPSLDPELLEEQSPQRGRTRQNNIPQYGLRNTVDLGQQQQQQDQQQLPNDADQDKTRGQRSWSAPPDNRTQNPTDSPRYVSRMDIPVNSGSNRPIPDQGKPPVAPKHYPSQQQTTQPPPQNTSTKQNQQGNVRHIPIFVEGRDEPLLPKEAEAPTEKPFPQSTFTYGRPSQFTGRSPPSQPPPQQQQQQPHNVSHKAQPPAFAQSSTLPRASPQQSQPRPQPSKPQPASPSVSQEGCHEASSTHPKLPANDPISRVEVVQKEVNELKLKVESFAGNSKDKEYLYLDEMLTRNLLKLDVIDTEGRDDVRQARKAVIRDIQNCICILESRVPNNDEFVQDSVAETEKCNEADLSNSTNTIASANKTESDVSAETGVGEAANLMLDGELKMETDVNQDTCCQTVPVNNPQTIGENTPPQLVSAATCESSKQETPSLMELKIENNDKRDTSHDMEPQSINMQEAEHSAIQEPQEAMEIDSSSKETVPVLSEEDKSNLPKVQAPPLNIKVTSKIKSPKGSPKKGKRPS